MEIITKKEMGRIKRFAKYWKEKQPNRDIQFSWTGKVTIFNPTSTESFEVKE